MKKRLQEINFQLKGSLHVVYVDRVQPLNEKYQWLQQYSTSRPTIITPTHCHVCVDTEFTIKINYSTILQVQTYLKLLSWSNFSYNQVWDLYNKQWNLFT